MCILIRIQQNKIICIPAELYASAKAGYMGRKARKSSLTFLEKALISSNFLFSLLPKPLFLDSRFNI